MKNAALAVIIVATVLPVSAQRGPTPSIGADVATARRAAGAQTIVVATVLSVTADFQTNQFGDRLIVSHADLKVEDALKGSPPPVVSLDVEGGTVGTLTLT